jgi:putative ABC transport system permease protein
VAREQEAPGPSVTFALLSDAPPSALAPAAARAIGEVNGTLSLEMQTMAEQLSGSIRRERLLATLSGFFGALALILATVGLYGTLAYGVARRKTEIGVRIALGARKAGVMRMVLGDAGRMVGAGLALGTLAALAATRVVASFLYGVEPWDASTLALSALLLGAVAVAARAVPAWRAARLDPMVALREE